MNEMDKPDRATLRRLAEALGVPVEQFFKNAMSTEATADGDECLRLWLSIRTAEGRARALKMLREIVEEKA
ncbi:hypothetical protein GCM10007890_01970 [Methylobacterium tardum]|uniref:HTH cro/C1-type domain-containing protein n=1 Tax=Methylobacterium tardum TaxID=374432 RepID=A0AA37WNT8_9HYPH|nr:hypothetical protein GCM10007890_01970 [Methylobacterium tardum]